MAFIDATRQSIRKVGTLTYASGGRAVLQMPRTGLLSRLYLHFSGTLTTVDGTGSLTLSGKGPWNLFNRVRFVANQGTSIFDTDGFAAHLLDVTSAGKMYEPDDSNRSVAVSADIYRAGVTADTTNAWDFNLCINLTPNDRDMMGLVLLQTDQMAAELQIEFNAAGGATFDYPVVLTNDATATLTGTVTVYAETFSLPATAADQPDITTLYQQLQRTDPVSAVGENRVNLLRANIYKGITHVVELNGALNSDSVERLRLQYNNADTPYDFNKQVIQAIQRRRYGRDLPAGVFKHDFYYQGVPGYGGARDLLSAAAVAELSSLVDIASGATLGSGNNKIHTITEQFVKLAQPQR